MQQNTLEILSADNKEDRWVAATELRGQYPKFSAKHAKWKAGTGCFMVGNDITYDGLNDYMCLVNAILPPTGENLRKCNDFVSGDIHDMFDENSQDLLVFKLKFAGGSGQAGKDGGIYLCAPAGPGTYQIIPSGHMLILSFAGLLRHNLEKRPGLLKGEFLRQFDSMYATVMRTSKLTPLMRAELKHGMSKLVNRVKFRLNDSIDHLNVKTCIAINLMKCKLSAKQYIFGGHAVNQD